MSCLHYQAYYPVDVINGPGTRCALFVSGCEHKCKGCYNAHTWRPDRGHMYTRELEDQIIADLNDTRIRRSGLTLTGGDPLHPLNVAAVKKLVERVRRECPGKNLWCWTGYVIEDLTAAQRELVALVDMLVDGPFVESLKDPGLAWRGSANQRLLDAAMIRDIFANSDPVPERHIAEQVLAIA